MFVFFINLQYFQVQARVLAHGSYTLAKKPFDKSAVYNDLESKENDPTGTNGTIKKRVGNYDRVFYFARFVLDVKTMLALVDWVFFLQQMPKSVLPI